ncbi:MAG: histidine kinase [Anaerolineae bacterium]
MKLRPSIEQNSLTRQALASQQLIAELETRLTQVTDQLVTAKASLDSESADHRRTEDEFRRSTEQLRELSARLQSVREEERTRISRAIHDELGQTLTGLKMDVAWLQGHLDPQQSALVAKMQAMSKLIDTTIQMVRRISTELRPGILDLGLVATIEWQLHEFQARTGIVGKLVSSREETTLAEDGSTAVFRILQEILTNVARHAQATQVKVSLEERAGFLTLQVQDNGRGMTESEIHWICRLPSPDPTPAGSASQALTMDGALQSFIVRAP